MSTLFEGGMILSTPLGSLVYHLLLLLAVEVMLGMAWQEWRRAPRGHAQRLFLGVGGLALARLIYIGAGLMAAAGWIDRAVLLPPLERCVDTASLALLAWVLLPAPPGLRQANPRDRFLLANLGAMPVVFVVFVALWSRAWVSQPGINYNDSWQAVVWSVWQIALAALAGLAVLRSRSEGWVMFLLAMAAALAGAALQLINPIDVPQIPVWERLGNLVAYPLLVVGIYQSVMHGLQVHSRELQDISQASMDQIKSMLFLFEAGREMSGSLDLATVLDNAVQGIARALDADQCAIAFPRETDPGQMQLAAVYNPARQGRAEGVAFPLDYQLAVRQAMRRKRYVSLEEADNVQLKVLFAWLGSSDVGPLLIQPLLADNESIGVIIVGNGSSRRAFTPNEAKLCQSIAEQVVVAIQNARRFRGMQTRTEELNRVLADERRASEQARGQIQELTDRLSAAQTELETLRLQEEAAREARNALAIHIVSSRAESESLADRLSSTESDLAQTRSNADAQLSWHRNELARQELAWHQALLTIEEQQARLQQVAARVDELKTSVATVGSHADVIARAGSSVEGSASSNFGRRLKADVESIAQAVDELTRLVGGIAQPVRLQPVDVTRVIEAAVAESQACLRDKDQEVELCMADALPAVEADPNRLREVVAHLLINAYLASPVGARIEVRASHSNGPSDRTDNLTGDGEDPFVVVSVRDCGGGLPPEALGDVFDRTRPVRIPQGLGASGADLAAVRSLVEIQHGRVWVETESGAGTTFSLALPVQGQG